MTVKDRAVFSDPEILELVTDHPDLLAIADAAASTQRARERRLRLPHAAVAAALVAAVAAIALVVPWGGRGHVVQRALAAIGDEPIVHVVVRSTTGTSMVDLSTGQERPTIVETEIWFDEQHGLERTVTRTNGRVTDETLLTPQGTWSSSGPVYDCAWIAAHPAQAAGLRISCAPGNASRAAPTLDPALSGFVTGYRDALASGRARVVGAGTVDGRAVHWLELAAQQGREQVAVDEQSGRPLQIRTLVDGRVAPGSVLSVETAEAISSDAASFAKPTPRIAPPAPASTGRTATRDTTAGAASAALGGRALWPELHGGLRLSRVHVDTVRIGYGPLAGTRPEAATTIGLEYGAAGSASFLSLGESLYLTLHPGYRPPDELRDGSVLVAPVLQDGRVSSWHGELVRGGVNVWLDASSKALLVEAARSLVPIPKETR